MQAYSLQLTLKDIQAILGATARVSIHQKEKVAYARVSSQAPKADLERQVSDLKELHSDHRIRSQLQTSDQVSTSDAGDPSP